MKLFEKLNKHKFELVYVPLGLYWIILFTATSLPGPSLPKLFLTLGDKIKHFGAYMVLAILLSIAFRVQEKFPTIKYENFKYSMIVCALYGIFDEIHQIFIPGRSFDLLDYAADLIGAAVGTLIVSRFIIRKERVESIKKY